METVQVFIKTEEEDRKEDATSQQTHYLLEEEDRKEDATTQQTPYLLEETPCIEPAIFER